MARSLLSILSFAAVAVVISCVGCGSTGQNPITPPPLPIRVTVSPASGIAQSGSTLKFAATVTNSTNTTVTWDVNGVSGGNATVGTISSTGLYTPPATIVDTTDLRITATSAADSGKTASATITVFAAPVIGVRIVSGAGEFYDRRTGEKFMPRGNNYVRLQDHLIVPPVNQVLPFQSMFAPGLYDAARVETALAAMENSGYNLVRVWLDNVGATVGIGNPSGAGLSSAYMANMADFLKRARNHHIFVSPVTDDVPKLGGYQQMIDPQCATAWPACWDLEYTTSGGVAADVKFWQDFIRALVQQHAPMDAIFSYQIREEYHYKLDLGPGDQAPILPASGSFKAANGQTYDMSDPAARERLKDDSLIFWTDSVRTAIQQIEPGAVVGVGFVTGANPYVPRFPVIAASTADYIDGHTGPGEGTTLTQDMSGWGKPAGPSPKPVIMGEFAARTTSIPDEADAAADLKGWQIESCNFGITGWALWSWDTAEHDTLGFPHWYALRGTGLVNQELAPANRPDPCQP